MKQRTIQPSPQRRAQSGFSIVEMLVGMTVGLVVIGGAVQLAVNTLYSNKKMVLETRVNQDLRTIADLIARDLRRAGYWENAASGVCNAVGCIPTLNPYGTVSPTGSITDQTSLTFSYDRDGASETQSGICLSGNVAYLRQSGSTACGGTGWAALNDSTVTRVTQMAISSTETTTHLLDQCETPVCSDGTSMATSGGPTCGPRLYVTTYTVSLSATAADGTVSRQLVERVRPRNERFNDQSVAANRCPS
jgi:type IV pilus assembly protein PilW